MPVAEQTDFRTKYKHFLKWTKYMRENMLKIDIDKFRDKWVPKFIKEVCGPVDLAWLKLSEDEREAFFPKDNTTAVIKTRRNRTAREALDGEMADSPF